MKIHSDEKIKKLKELRRTGHSINEIVRDLSIPKTTVWHHIKKITVDPEYVLLWKSKISSGSRCRREKKLKIAEDLAKKMLNSPDREYLIILSMLYWAEGCKKAFNFVNSDGRMVDLYVKILIKIFGIDKKRIIPTMRIFSQMDKKECLEHWSRVTGLPKDRFFVRIDDGGRESSTRYGMCRITISKGSDTLKLVNSLIQQFYDQLIKTL
ncbi:MAG: hypothetical protein NTV36_02130 [Candidatus Staskawiczbacteria bacterium]|nr:hypothetical protein [Candidatus Staskawiczbacteria bacterium]